MGKEIELLLTMTKATKARIEKTMRRARFSDVSALHQAAFALYDTVIEECDWQVAELILRYPNGEERKVQYRPEEETPKP